MNRIISEKEISDFMWDPDFKGDISPKDVVNSHEELRRQLEFSKAQLRKYEAKLEKVEAPTQWAYDQVCKANEAKRVKLIELEAQAAAMRECLTDLARFDIDPKYLANGHGEVARNARKALDTGAGKKMLAVVEAVRTTIHFEKNPEITPGRLIVEALKDLDEQ